MDKVYILAFEESDYRDFSSCIIGVYNTKEKAKEKLLNELRDIYLDNFNGEEDEFQDFLKEYLSDNGTRFEDDDIDNPCRYYIVEMNVE